MIGRTGMDLDGIRLQRQARGHPLALDAVPEDIDGGPEGDFCFSQRA
jgi:hypothetical protein